MATEKGRCRIQSVLFMCAVNAVRSPMAQGLTRHCFGRSLYVASAGVRSDDMDPFTIVVMDEIGISLSCHKPHAFEELEDTGFDLIVRVNSIAR